MNNEFSGFVKDFHGEYLVLNRHGTSIMKTFFTEALDPDSLRFLASSQDTFFG